MLTERRLWITYIEVDQHEMENNKMKEQNQLLSILSHEYSYNFDTLRANRVVASFYKYGSAKANFSTGNVNALATMERCVEKYNETGNTEYLCDAANYLMFEFMYPQHPKAHFEATDSNGSAGIVGLSAKEIEEFRKENDWK